MLLIVFFVRSPPFQLICLEIVSQNRQSSTIRENTRPFWNSHPEVRQGIAVNHVVPFKLRINRAPQFPSAALVTWIPFWERSFVQLHYHCHTWMWHAEGTKIMRPGLMPYSRLHIALGTGINSISLR